MADDEGYPPSRARLARSRLAQTQETVGEGVAARIGHFSCGKVANPRRNPFSHGLLRLCQPRPCQPSTRGGIAFIVRHSPFFSEGPPTFLLRQLSTKKLLQ